MHVQLEALDNFNVRLTFTNKTESEQGLALDRIGGEELNGNFFNFDPLPAPIYLPPKLLISVKGVFAVPPGEQAITTVNLAKYYDLSDRAEDVPLRVSYRAPHPLYVETTRIVQSNWAVFPYGGFKESS